MTDPALVNRINSIKERIKAQRAQAAKVAVEAGEKVIRKGFAENVVIGWEKPDIALQYTILVREVKELKPEAFYQKVETDSEGFVVGTWRERIWNSKEKYDSDRADLEKQGFVAEAHPEAKRYIP